MKRLIGGAAILLVIAGAVWAYGEHQQRVGAAQAEAQEQRERARAAEAALRSLDEASRLRVDRLTSAVDSLEREGARLDTVVRVRTVRLRELVPDSVKPAVDSLVAACDRRQAACREAKDSLRSVVTTREGQLAARDSLLAARDSLVANLERQIDPPFLAKLFGDLPSTLTKVGAGVILGVVVAQ